PGSAPPAPPRSLRNSRFPCVPPCGRSPRTAPRPYDSPCARCRSCSPEPPARLVRQLRMRIELVRVPAPRLLPALLLGDSLLPVVVDLAKRDGCLALVLALGRRLPRDVALPSDVGVCSPRELEAQPLALA